MQTGKLSENSKCIPNTRYGTAKHLLHEQLIAFQAEHPFALTWARLFYLYGDGHSRNVRFYP